MPVSGPRVSVCISTYNRSHRLRDAIDSVLGQTFGDFELIVSDDCSPDDTAAVVTRYRDPRLRYHRHERNQGLVANYNRCLRLAGGEYVGIFDDDDLYVPTTLAATVEALDAHPEAGFVCGVAEEIDNDGRPVGARRLLAADAVLDPAAAFAHFLVLNNVPRQPTTLMRARAVAQVGPYDEVVGAFANDMDMWLRLASHYPVVYLNRVLARYRRSSASETKRGEADGTNAVSLRMTIRKALAAPPGGRRPPHRVVRRACRQAARYELAIAFGFLYRGDYRSFQKHTAAALTFAPELVASPGGLAAIGLGAASLAGGRGPRFLWWLRDRFVGRRSARRAAGLGVDSR